MVEVLRGVPGRINKVMVVLATTDRELATLASTDRVVTGQVSIGRVGEVFHPILQVQHSLLP